MTDRRQPRVLLASLTVVLATFLFRLAAFNGFENDHFMHVAWAQQVLFGDWPGRAAGLGRRAGRWGSRGIVVLSWWG